MKYEEARQLSGVVLIEFFASWCPHCRRMEPVVDEVRDLLGSRVPVYTYDIDQYPAAAEAARADTVPTFIVYRDGREMWRHSGEIGGDEIMKHVEKALG